METSGGSSIARNAAASRSRSSITARTSGGDASAATASAAESVVTGAGAWRAFSSAAVSSEASAYPIRAPARPKAFENVRSTITPSSSSGTAVSPQYSKYASSQTSGRASGSGRSSPSGLFGRQVNVSTGSTSPTSAPASCAAMR